MELCDGLAAGFGGRREHPDLVHDYVDAPRVRDEILRWPRVAGQHDRMDAGKIPSR